MAIHEFVKTPVRDRSGVPVSQPKNICLQCGSRELRGQPQSVFRHLFSLVVFICGRCEYRETRFRFSKFTVIAPIVVVLLVAGAFYLVSFTGSSATTPDALARVRTSSGGLPDYETMGLRKPRATLDNAAVLKLWNAGVGSEVIVQMIRTSNADYDLSGNAVIQLKDAGVDRTIILAMIDTSYNAR